MLVNDIAARESPPPLNAALGTLGPVRRGSSWRPIWSGADDESTMGRVFQLPMCVGPSLLSWPLRDNNTNLTFYQCIFLSSVFLFVRVR